MRDLDTDERSVIVRQRWEEKRDPAIRTQLIDVVHELRPGAWPRSYSGGVASFVDGKYLIVARYGDECAPPPGERPPGAESEQRPLFEDAA